LCISPADLSGIAGPHAPWQLQTFTSISGPDFPLAVRFPPDSGAYLQHVRLGLIPADAPASRPVHPVQLYEAFLAFILAALLHFAFRNRRRKGQIACAWLIGYGLIRFTTEFLRADNIPAWAALTVSQWISVGLAVSGIVGWLLVTRVWDFSAEWRTCFTRSSDGSTGG
jgi:prolipoprotein diacylglyceryltransferase